VAGCTHLLPGLAVVWAHVHHVSSFTIISDGFFPGLVWASWSFPASGLHIAALVDPTAAPFDMSEPSQSAGSEEVFQFG